MYFNKYSYDIVFSHSTQEPHYNKGPWDYEYLSNIDCLQGNTTYIARTEGEGDI